MKRKKGSQFHPKDRLQILQTIASWPLFPEQKESYDVIIVLYVY